MRPNDPNTMYFYKQPIDVDLEDAASPAPPSSPTWNSDTSMFWGLSQRIDSTEKQTRELSSQSERQLRLMQAITKSQNQHEREQREAMTSLLSRIEQNETRISGLQHSTQTLTLNQRQTQQDVLLLQEELLALREQVQAQQQQHGRGTVLRRVIRGATVGSQTEVSSGSSNVNVPQPGPIFKDVYGRRRRLCRYCGDNLDASYCIKHEKNEVCLRRCCNKRTGCAHVQTSAVDYSLEEARP